LHCSQSREASECVAKHLIAEVPAIRESWSYKDFAEVTKWYHTEILFHFIDADGLDWFIKQMVKKFNHDLLEMVIRIVAETQKLAGSSVY
jgi:hypothetical protein